MSTGLTLSGSAAVVVTDISGVDCATGSPLALLNADFVNSVREV